MMISMSEFSLQPNFGEQIFADSTGVPGEGDFTPQFTPPVLTTVTLMPFTDLGKLQMVVLLVWNLQCQTGQKKIPDIIDFAFQLDTSTWLPLLFYMELFSIA